MAVEYRRFTVTTPAGTPKASPQTAAITIPVRGVSELRVRVPPGPAGNLGFQVWVGGNVVIPFDLAQWVIADNESISYPTSDFPESGAWSIQTYNTGSYPHTLWVTLACELPTPPPTLVRSPIAAGLISGN